MGNQIIDESWCHHSCCRCIDVGTVKTITIIFGNRRRLIAHPHTQCKFQNILKLKHVFKLHTQAVSWKNLHTLECRDKWHNKICGKKEERTYGLDSTSNLFTFTVIHVFVCMCSIQVNLCIFQCSKSDHFSILSYSLPLIEWHISGLHSHRLSVYFCYIFILPFISL